MSTMETLEAAVQEARLLKASAEGRLIAAKMEFEKARAEVDAAIQTFYAAHDAHGKAVREETKELKAKLKEAEAKLAEEGAA
ncbi:hypothetical protein [Novosphingobium guangzhouense]|uniref:Uncharacterized protein n=1 Tax=Novosphingobium guangzhouense TaxID=1850347 RepID=A0A2K2G0N6_9SPHN|nr:hypothetical protein [Novosphingobium guangzhouense]PNU04615.1 hypothetical protein A8V01_19595 [Novosphingobium guangzhouense]